MEVAGFAGILASLLGLALTVYGVFVNSRATRALVRELHGETQSAVAVTQAAVEAGGRDTRALIESTHRDTRSLIESTHQDTRALIESTHQDTQRLLEAIRADVKAVHENGQRRHDDLVAYMQDIDRRHTELLATIATRP